MRDVRTPSEINHEARLHLEAGFGRLWVEGEISNLSRPASGHLYFSLRDEKAQISCALFRSSARGLGFRPDNGQLVQAHGKLSLYEASGRYQLIVDRLEVAGEGRLRAAFEALKNKLDSEGLFDPTGKLELPNAPTRIGVITSSSGAVIRDILHVLQRRWPLAAVRLYPVPVQGDEAPAAIVSALASANRNAWAQAIILGRGGGSLEDLWAFNEEAVARAIHASNIPVISAVGHETDFSISDFVADVRAPTPSAAAEVLTPDQAMLRRSLDHALTQLSMRWQDAFRQRAQQADHLGHRLAQQHPDRQLQRHSERLELARERLLAARGRFTPARRDALDALRRRLTNSASQVLPERQQRLQSLARTLHAVSPLPTLARGYAVVTDQQSGKAISSIDAAQPGQATVTLVRDGRIVSVVEETQPGDPDFLSGNHPDNG
jgi:exodeoxyribonuclease VII large subunit